MRRDFLIFIIYILCYTYFDGYGMISQIKKITNLLLLTSKVVFNYIVTIFFTKPIKNINLFRFRTFYNIVKWWEKYYSKALVINTLNTLNTLPSPTEKHASAMLFDYPKYCPDYDIDNIGYDTDMSPDDYSDYYSDTYPEDYPDNDIRNSRGGKNRTKSKRDSLSYRRKNQGNIPKKRSKRRARNRDDKYDL